MTEKVMCHQTFWSNIEIQQNPVLVIHFLWSKFIYNSRVQKLTPIIKECNTAKEIYVSTPAPIILKPQQIFN